VGGDRCSIDQAVRIPIIPAWIWCPWALHPVDPYYLYYVRAKLGYPFRCVELAEEINNPMPAYLARRVQVPLNRNTNAVRGASVVAGHDLAAESDLYGAVANTDACVMLKPDRKHDVDELALGAGSREALR
jgi:hypothetical protein